MSCSVQIRPAAERDLAEAYAWYERQKPGLGDVFLEYFELALDFIRDNPRAYVEVHRGLRRAAMRKFPYGVVFQENDDEVFIVGVIHARRHPRNWQARGT